MLEKYETAVCLGGVQLPNTSLSVEGLTHVLVLAHVHTHMKGADRGKDSGQGHAIPFIFLAGDEAKR